MSNSSWSEPLVQTLARLTPKDNLGGKINSHRIAILGIGNELNGDDAAGVEVIRGLRKRLAGAEHILLLEGGLAPENVTGLVRGFRPQLVILVDCADFGASAGAVAWLDLAEIDGLSATTHTLPPTVLAHFLISELNCQIGLIGIQPESLDFGSPMSKAVRKAVKNIVANLAYILIPTNDVRQDE